MTDSKQEPKIIDRFDYLEFLVDGEWKKIPSQEMLEALIHFPKPGSPDLYRLDHYRKRFELRNRQYDSEENQQILRGWSNFLINGYAKGLKERYLSRCLLAYTPKIKYKTHTFEVDTNIAYYNTSGNEIISIDGNPIVSSETTPPLDTNKIVQWFIDNNLRFEKYVYAEIMAFYCFHILPPTTSRYTAISDNLEIAERKFIRNDKLTPKEHLAYEKRRIFFDSLKRRFLELKEIFPEYEELQQQLLQDENTADILNGFLDDAKTQIGKDKANKSRIEKELGMTIRVFSQCVFCYKFHYQTTKKKITKKGATNKGGSGKGKTSLVRYCPNCKDYCHLWVGDTKTLERENYPLSKIPLNGW